MPLIGQRVALLLAQAGCALREIYLFILVIVFELVVVGIVKGLREGIAESQVISNPAQLPTATCRADQQPVVQLFAEGSRMVTLSEIPDSASVMMQS